MLTKNGVLELTPSGIWENAILPGLVQTPLTKCLFDNDEIHAVVYGAHSAGKGGAARRNRSTGTFPCER
jgi:hypothetical protein